MIVHKGSETEVYSKQTATISCTASCASSSASSGWTLRLQVTQQRSELGCSCSAASDQGLSYRDSFSYGRSRDEPARFH
nr:hypothetical protein CFP56_04567 [Quercus suber]